MSLADTPDTQPKGKKPARKRGKPLLTGLLVSVVVIGGLIAIMLSYHPRWHTVTGIGKPGAWVGSVECPEDWQLDTQGERLHNMGFTSLIVRRQPLSGIMGWWYRVVLRRPAEGDATEVSVFIMPQLGRTTIKSTSSAPLTHDDKAREANTALDNFEMGYKVALRGTPRKRAAFQRVSHPLGPALAASLDETAPVQAGATRTISMVPSRYESLCIAPTEAGDFTGMVMVSTLSNPNEANALKPVLDRIIHSIRVVKK